MIPAILAITISAIAVLVSLDSIAINRGTRLHLTGRPPENVFDRYAAYRFDRVTGGEQ